ncbi:GNAT family N-acetyltransferase [Candidatus Bathyarchaeota archaeon]|nr:GNAT family N-acetyltransferase [Candidatus Bathyarchaeota archaeon]
MLIQIRNFTEEDLPILLDLLNKTYRSSYEFVPYTEERLRARIQEGKFKILMVVEDGKILGSATYNDGYWGEEIRWVMVNETPNRKTIENELVKEAEKCVKGEKVFTVLDAESPAIIDWIERGYRFEGGLYHMVARLDGEKLLPMVLEGVSLRSLKHDEEKEFVEAVNAGFGLERVQLGAIQKWKVEDSPFSEEWIHVAEIGGKIVSVVVSRPDVDYNKAFNGKRGYLGPAATLPEHRNNNLASALTCRAMNFLFRKGMNSVALHTSEQNLPSVALLNRLGFETGHHWKFMRKYLKS